MLLLKSQNKEICLLIPVRSAGYCCIRSLRNIPGQFFCLSHHILPLLNKSFLFGVLQYPECTGLIRGIIHDILAGCINNTHHRHLALYQSYVHSKFIISAEKLPGTVKRIDQPEFLPSFSDLIWNLCTLFRKDG